jgi:Transglutaminase-like superfamily
MQGLMTDPGKYAELFDGLPAEPAGIARVVQGLMIHEFWLDAYGVTMTAEQRETVHLRRVEQMLDVIAQRDGRPLGTAREPAARMATNCRGFTVLAVAMLRSVGVPARARCGFGAYFRTGWFEDHWVVEWRDAAQDRWRLMDAQIDELQRERLAIRFDLTDVPRDQFVVAGDAWVACRSGRADPGRFGLSSIGEAGLWWVAANLLRDAAALADVEVLPWDLWGAMPGPADEIDVTLFDRLAELVAEPSIPELRRFLDGDERVRVPAKVHNALRDRDEPL